MNECTSACVPANRALESQDLSIAMLPCPAAWPGSKEGVINTQNLSL